MRTFTWLSVVAIVSLILPISTSAQSPQLPSLTGQIAYIGTDGNVYVLEPGSKNTTPLTSNASSQRLYSWPTWSDDGRLAYFQTSIESSTLQTDVYISPKGNEAGKKTASLPGHVFTYAYWSPENCDEGEKCRFLAVLLSNTTERKFSVQIVRNNSAETIASQAGQGVPFYYSWSPDGNRMIWQRNNETLDIYDAGKSKAIKVLSQAPGFIQAPSWSPIDDRWLIGILNADKRSTDLAIITEKEAQILAAQLTGPVSAAWSPNGNYVAYTDRRGPLIILDANTGKTIARSSVTGVLAFFWSPNSEHIAYVTLATSPGSFSANGKTGTKVAAYLQETTRLAWSVIDIPTGSTRRYGSWLPTREMVYLLSFFDQFSQSHRIWSPDSRYLVFSETNANNRSSISLLDTTQADSVPLSIADGLIAIWSYN